MLYFAYGSNLNKREMRQRCPSSKYIGTAMLKDWQLMFRYFLTIEPKEGMKVPIGVWEVSEKDIKSLDKYEGYPSLYKKEKMTIGNYTGFIYIMKNSIIPYILPEREYFYRCSFGYINFGFDWSYLTDAFTRTAEEIKNEYGLVNKV